LAADVLQKSHQICRLASNTPCHAKSKDCAEPEGIPKGEKLCNPSFEQMIVSANQPYFAPFPGLFLKALRSDILVLMDSVQFPQGTTWLTRNRFKNDQGTLWMTIPVCKKGLGLQKIDEIKICREGRWAKKHLASLKTAYAKAPFFEQHLPFLEGLFSNRFEKLIDLNLKIIHYMTGHLKIRAKILLLSQLDIKEKEPRLSIEVCRKLGAAKFLAQSGAKKYLEEEAFRAAGVELQFFNPRPPVYPQLWGPFIPNLSTFDILFNCGPKAYDILKMG
jgi:hypothetical protein